MKHLILTIAILTLTVPLYGQEIDLGLGGDVGGLLNLPAPTGNRGAPAGARGAPPGGRGAPANAPAVDRLVRLRELLSAANTPLSTEQEAGLNSLLNSEIPIMRQKLQARITELQRAVPTAPAPAGGAGPSSAPPQLSMDEIAPEIIRLNDELLGKVAAAPQLSAEQQSRILKLYKDQVKSRGGFDAIRLTMEDAKVPFSEQQVSQIQPLFDELNESRAKLLRDSQGQPPDKATLDQLQRETLGKVLRLLTTAQRAALTAPPGP